MYTELEHDQRRLSDAVRRKDKFSANLSTIVPDWSSSRDDRVENLDITLKGNQ